MPDLTDTLLVRVGQLEAELRRLETKVHELEIEMRGYWWGESNAVAEAQTIRHYDDA